jgi:hypothetical protein
MLAGLREQERPVPDETETASVTVPVNPLIGDIVMVDVPAVPARMVMLLGLAETEKSGTVTL